jgi:hypothetical protein
MVKGGRPGHAFGTAWGFAEGHANLDRAYALFL